MVVSIYTYHSYLSLFHLTWLLFSFILPIHAVFRLSSYIMLPILIVEYFTLYAFNLSYFQDKETFLDLKYPLLELSLLYVIVILFCMMISTKEVLNDNKNTIKS